MCRQHIRQPRHRLCICRLRRLLNMVSSFHHIFCQIRRYRTAVWHRVVILDMLADLGANSLAIHTVVQTMSVPMGIIGYLLSITANRNAQNSCTQHPLCRCEHGDNDPHRDNDWPKVDKNHHRDFGYPYYRDGLHHVSQAVLQFHLAQRQSETDHVEQFNPDDHFK